MSVEREQNTKFPYIHNTINEAQFNCWTSRNNYRTKYNDMRSNVLLNKSQSNVRNIDSCIPKYSGFVPTIKAETLIGKTNTELSRRAYSLERSEAGEYLFSSTGYIIL